MALVERKCKYCEGAFKVRQSEINRGYGLYCSPDCGHKDRKGKSRVAHEDNVVCSYCDKPFYTNDTRISKSKSGLYFCCREHKDLAQRIGGIKDIQPSHYTDSKKDYREIAFRESVNPKCERCGWNEYPQVLEVHHKDCNRKNNDISNLEILCPTCHSVEHFLTQTGTFKKNKKGALV